MTVTALGNVTVTALRNVTVTALRYVRHVVLDLIFLSLLRNLSDAQNVTMAWGGVWISNRIRNKVHC